MRLVFAGALACLLSVPLSAQWVPFVRADVPRTANGLRQIFTDGRPMPANELQPWWFGYSVGKWDGDTLVVETTGLRDDGWLDVAGAPFTNTAKITERLRRVNYGRLEIDITIDDSKSYTRPWTVRVNQRLAPDEQLIEFVCIENEQSSKHYDK
jgi:hypothetical protein